MNFQSRRNICKDHPESVCKIISKEPGYICLKCQAQRVRNELVQNKANKFRPPACASVSTRSLIFADSFAKINEKREKISRSLNSLSSKARGILSERESKRG
jgi:hypothetical protein